MVLDPPSQDALVLWARIRPMLMQLDETRVSLDKCLAQHHSLHESIVARNASENDGYPLLKQWEDLHAAYRQSRLSASKELKHLERACIMVDRLIRLLCIENPDYARSLGVDPSAFRGTPTPGTPHSHQNQSSAAAGAAGAHANHRRTHQISATSAFKASLALSTLPQESGGNVPAADTTAPSVHRNLPNRPLRAGAFVVIKSTEKDGTNWILGETQEIQADKILVQDADTPERKFLLPETEVLRLPIEADRFFFSPSAIVLALYPESTAFYKAVVVRQIMENNRKHYELLFDEERIHRKVEHVFVTNFVPLT